MSKPPFVHLHTHTHYSLLDGLSQTERMVKLAKKYEMPALAITDHGNMYGAIEFYKLCQKEGIKPIIGVEAYIAIRKLTDKDPGVDDKRYHLTLLAKNEAGYRNLLKLVSISGLEGYYYKPRMDHELLRAHSDGLICLSGCFGSELSRALRIGNVERAREVIGLYRDIFGKENYFLEVMHHPGIAGFMETRNQIVQLGREFDIPLVATQDSHYLAPDDKRAHEVMLAINTDSTMGDQNKFSMNDGDFSFIDTETGYKNFVGLEEAVENTSRIADMCNLELSLGRWVFPTLNVPDGRTPDEELEKLTKEGLKERGLEETQEVKNRIEYELKIIRDKGYAPYFLVVADLLRFATEKNIYTNIRGSVAGSIITYLIGITKVNPLEYKLPFERFLNPERPSAPDIDMDFADNRRDEVIEYAVQKYGADKTAQIGTFGTMLARGVVRDVARALGQPYALGDKISRLIPMGSQGFPMTIKRAFELEPELRKMYETDPATKEIIDVGKRLEGCVRHISVHAAGVVIAPTPLTDYTPLQLDPRGGKVITQYDMYTMDDAGLLKFDFLGIRNLAILADAVERVEKIQRIKIDIEKIPMDDGKTFKMLARGETMGLFQLNGSGMTRFLKDLRPTSIHDINAMVALYRPGPLEMIPEYIRRKHDSKLVSFLDPRMKDILDQSYGVITYQDDVLLIAIKLAGYSWLEADKLRKAMGKKIPAEMVAQKEKLLEGLVEHGMTSKKTEELWHLIEPFAAYGFNKAHAASYGRVAYQTAYMKANFPAEYMTAVLTAESGDVEEVAKIIEECKRMAFEILPPDINESYSDFTVVKGTSKIRFGSRSIKNFGEEIGRAIIKERKANGIYKNYSDFLARIQHKNLNKKSLESLIMAGAFDSLGERGQMLANIEEALAFNRALTPTESNQASLFGSGEAVAPKFNMKSAPPATLGDRLRWEKELLGLYISGHPLETHKAKFDKHDQTIDKIVKMEGGTPVLVAGLLDNVKVILTKKDGNKMMFARLEDFTGSIELVAFTDTYAEFKDILVANECVAIRGFVSHRNGSPSIVVEKAKKL
ncbi:MAG: DNA polymerase III subunit alpha [Parcubacteria group bacterium RIFCSPHIGHO2_01_FULL_45_26]|nr:MAG: DNA polymerase III subunit alpha [Parcubacteria group bacterium RIFCSPHIGHO2_01_FULL_45_26]